MNTVGTILLAILIFGAFVFVHELGHFLSAKAFNMKVNDFAIGFGPALFKFTKGETTYAVRAFPLGGYVALDGEDEESDDERSFHKQKIWKRFIVMAAGGVMNLLLGFIVVLIVLGMQQTLGTTTISNFQPQPVSNSVLQVGDQILKINGSRVHIDNDIVFGLVRDEDARVDMQIKRGNELLNLQVPFQMTKNPDGTNSVYIDFTVYPMEKNFFNVSYNGVFYTGSIAKMVWISLGDLISGKFSVNQLSGPVGVTAVISQASSMGLRPLLMLVAFITINLGVFNLLPLPALDGGKLLFLCIEAIFRKPVPPKYENYVHTAGMILLLGLMLFVTFNDITRLFFK
ncbi:RIP metalloprotease RseP [Hydrogenoanaerobacterium saccharovorans]|uniref:RIP metalloprotease RseP n=1 Tax=Hydrogenoanaerobacterium saccharovorans TaxID=474960 RepID=UPI000B816AF1|nr:RIP metalloprotease RseP [Hydrogenoanaerobacterium saccharovorans]